MTDEWKSHTENGILVVKQDGIAADERIIYDYPSYYYNRVRADQHYARDFSHRLCGVTYKTAYDPFIHAENKMRYLCRIERAKQYMADNNIKLRQWT